jgi:hypothetical protein
MAGNDFVAIVTISGIAMDICVLLRKGGQRPRYVHRRLTYWKKFSSIDH